MTRASGEPPAGAARGANADSPSALADSRMAASPDSPTGHLPAPRINRDRERYSR
jgi:hypothetical protein